MVDDEDDATDKGQQQEGEEEDKQEYVGDAMRNCEMAEATEIRERRDLEISKMSLNRAMVRQHQVDESVSALLRRLEELPGNTTPSASPTKLLQSSRSVDATLPHADSPAPNFAASLKDASSSSSKLRRQGETDSAPVISFSLDEDDVSLVASGLPVPVSFSAPLDDSSSPVSSMFTATAAEDVSANMTASVVDDGSKFRSTEESPSRDDDAVSLRGDFPACESPEAVPAMSLGSSAACASAEAHGEAGPDVFGPGTPAATLTGSAGLPASPWGSSGLCMVNMGGGGSGPVDDTASRNVAPMLWWLQRCC
jgi:hypothetical protein